MSINDFLNKIKGKSNIDGVTVMCLFVLVLVAMSSFGLGRLSLNNSNNNFNKLDNGSIQVVKSEIGKSGEEKSLNETDDKETKMYIASKNGKLYYSLDCNGAKRISEKNAIWFADRDDAEKSGYTFASSCN